jgi:hypothetical protein
LGNFPIWKKSFRINGKSALMPASSIDIANSIGIRAANSCAATGTTSLPKSVLIRHPVSQDRLDIMEYSRVG